MNTGIVASPICKSLLYFATQNGEAEMVYAEMQQLDRNFRELPALRNIPNNPVLDNAQKAAVITEAARLNDDSEVSNSTQRFIRLVVNKGRAELLQFIATSFLSAYEHEHHITRAYLTTAEAVAPEIENACSDSYETALETPYNCMYKRTRNSKQALFLATTTIESMPVCKDNSAN